MTKINVLAHAQSERQPNLKRRKYDKNESQTLVLRPDYVGAFRKIIEQRYFIYFYHIFIYFYQI